MSSSTSLRLGTRPSLLAIAQSRLVKTQLEELHPQLHIELVQLETRGERDQRTPLTAVADPDFFSAELDNALLHNEVDFCVHSYKDLSRERPASIVTAAIPARETPHDVVLFRTDIDAVL
jgi:hydroxymethylbilane synthase